MNDSQLQAVTSCYELLQAVTSCYRPPARWLMNDSQQQRRLFLASDQRRRQSMSGVGGDLTSACCNRSLARRLYPLRAAPAPASAPSPLVAHPARWLANGLQQQPSSQRQRQAENATTPQANPERPLSTPSIELKKQFKRLPMSTSCAMPLHAVTRRYIPLHAVTCRPRAPGGCIRIHRPTPTQSHAVPRSPTQRHRSFPAAATAQSRPHYMPLPAVTCHFT